MKVTPKKLLLGGSFGQFFTVYDPLPAQQLSGTASSRESKSSKKSSDDDDTKGKLTEKDLFGMIKDINGLPNEMQGIISKLMNTFLLQNLVGESAGNIATTYLLNLLLIKLASQNKTKFDDAVKATLENGALSELAISLNGNLLVLNALGKIEEVPYLQYMRNRNAYNPLTNSNLAYMRSHSMSMAGDLSTFDILLNSIGFESFLKILKLGITGLGSSTNKYNGMFTANKQAVKGLELVQQLLLDDRVRALGNVTLEGLYEYNIIDLNQGNQIEALVTYLNALLPTRVKTWAGLKTGQVDRDAATKTLIKAYLLSGSTDSHEFRIDYKGTEDHVMGNGKGKGGSSKGFMDMDTNSSFRWLLGFGVSKDYVINSGTTLAFNVTTNAMPLTNSEGKQLGVNCTLEEVSKGQYSGVLDFTNATMGGSKIETTTFNQILVSDGKITKVDYPIDPTKPEPTPMLDPDTVEKYKQVNKKLKEAGIDKNNPDSVSKNYLKVQQIYKDAGIPVAYTQDGHLDTTTWRTFGVMNGVADHRALSKNANPRLLQEIYDEDQAESAIQAIKDKNSSYSGRASGFLWSDWGKDIIYRGTIWIPVDTNYHAAMPESNMSISESNELGAFDQLVGLKLNNRPRI